MTEYTPFKNISITVFFNLFSLTQWQSYRNKISVCLSICLSKYLYLYIYVYISLSIFIYICIYTYIYIYMYIYKCIYICIYIYMCVCVFVCVCVCIYISGQKWSTTHRVLKSHRSKMGVYTSCPQVHELPQSHCGDN